MECLFGFASSVSRDLVCGALNQLRYPCCFKNFVKKLEEEESNLIITKDSVQKFVTHNKKQARKPSEIVDKWLENAINDVHNVNQLLEEARTQKHCCFGHSPNWIWRYHVGKKLANKTMHLEKIIEEGKKYVPFDRIATLPSNTLHMLSEKCMNFESRQSAYEQLRDAVKNNDVFMIGLFGMGGCGKTTLAMEVKKFVEAEHLFEKVLFVPVSSTVEVGRIQEKIASSLQFEFPETEEMQRAQRLCSRLTQEKNIFIILDDVWENLDFGRIGIPSSEHHKGCKILITSRSEAVCTLMDCQRKIYLPILTDEEAWTLFQNKALIREATSDTLKEIGRLISNECKGLPVAIAAVACSLKGKAETVWRVALNKLRHSKPINIERGLTDPYKCLQLSYDNLDTKEAKSLFLLCFVFAEDFEIHIENLTRCAIGLGVVGEVDSYEEARSEVIAAKIKLVSCCLLLDADHECVKMHDIVRDVAHIIAKDENKMIKCEVEKDVRVEQNSVRYLWCVKFPNDLDCSNLELLCLRTKMKEFDGIFKRMGMLKVLILKNDEYGRTPLSTISFETLTNLRYLFIENYELSDFSFFGGMKNLQSLSLWNCLLPSFPELQTDVAITLKLLDLNGCNIKVKNFEVIKRIPLLEELYIIEWDANSEDNIEFFKTFSVPETLQRYGIVLGTHKFDRFDYEGIFIHGRTLFLNHFDISNEVIKGLTKRAKDLIVENIHGGAKNIIPDIFQIEGGGLDELNMLKIHDSEELECLIDTRSHSSEVVTLFSKLHTLGIENMRNLRVIWHCFLPANGPFENLEKFDLSDCPRLTFLFTYVLARNFVKLKILKISRCDELKYILADDDKTEEGEDEFPTGHPVQIFHNLQDVKINRCRELKHIFPANIVGGLTQLKVVEIEECDKLDQIIGDIVPSTDRDKVIEEGTLSSPGGLKIKRCGKLGSIFTASFAKNLTLEKLYIRDCELLEGIFPVSFVGELNDITNKEAADLEDFSSRNNTQIELPALQLLELRRIRNITVVGSYDVICPSLRKLSLDIGRYVGFFNINCSSDASEATKRDSIAIKISNSDFDPPVESVECLSKQPHGLNLIMTHNIREIELKGFDTAEYLFKLSIASSLTMLEILRIEECEGLEYIIDTDDEYGKENMKAIFPNLKQLYVHKCFQLKYMFGQYDVANKDYKEIHIQFSALEILFLQNLPKFVSICSTNNLIVTWPSLKEFECYKCLCPFYGSREAIITSTKDPKGIQNHLPSLQTLNITDSDPERIFCLNEHEMIGQQVSLRLENLELNTLPQMTYIWVGPNNSLTLQHLTTLQIWNCGKLEVIFPKSVVRCLPKLKLLIIKECKELRQIIEGDRNLSNILSPQPCFPKLEALYVDDCHKLKRLFSGSASNDLPNLHLLAINAANELEELVGCKQGKIKVELPRLKLLIFMHLENFSQEIELHNVKNCIVYKCPILSLTSTTTFEKLLEDFPSEDFVNTEVGSWEFEAIVRFIYHYSTINDSSEFTSSQKIEDVGNESIKSSSTGVEDIGIGGAVATHIAKVVEQDDKMNEGKPGIVASQGIQVQEGLNLLHKQEGIYVAPNNNIVNRLLEEARTKNMCCFGYCPNWIWRYRMGKKLANKVFDLEKFIEEGKKYVSFDRIPTLPSGTLDILSEKCMNFESRQSAYEQILDAVKNNDVSMIGLYGMGGCGKTTLAMEIRKFVDAEHLFEKVLFVPVSSTVEVGRIQEKIASSLQVEFLETEEMQRAQRLCSRLTQEKNVFIILDDVWEKLDFGRIGIPSSEHHKGCKILITSRSEAVCTLMDCQRKIYLPILTDEEAWTLFQNKALITEATSDTLKEIGRLISDECKGLPVAIAAVACSLKGKAETVWRVALNKLRHSKPINIERGLTDPYKCLQLSYDNLDTKEAKSLFLLCFVFPKDFEIHIEILTRCAIGLGVVGEVDSYEEARSEVIAAKIKLVSCCLLLDADDERVKMHDIVRDVAHIIAKDENKIIKCEMEKDVRVEQNSVRYLWCWKFPNDLDCSNLEFLRLGTKMKEFDGIFKRMGMLKVLILQNDEDGKTRLSTISFKTLTNLRCLFIANYELSDYSFFGGMKNLQSLSLWNCLLPSFPELQTDVAITLKLLDLKRCNIKVKNFEVIKRIPLLEELYIIEIEGEWDAYSEENIEFFKTFSIPETLQRYGIVLGSRYFDHYSDGDIYIHGRTLLLNHFDISNEVIKGLAKRAKDLFVATIHGGAKNIIPDIFQIEGGHLDELNKLEIHDSQELECLIEPRSHSSEVVTLFSKLHTLGIENMRNLRVIWHCFLPANGHFENLEKFDLSDCPRLTFLFTYVLARNFVKLKILKISRCDELKYILADDDKTEEGEDEFTTGHPVQIFQNLQDVQINSCRELKHIFPANIVGGLTHLKVVEIEECDKLDQIIGDIVPLTEEDRKEELDEIVEEGKHPHLYNTSIPTTTVVKQSPGTLSSLASLKITCCGKLGSIFTASIAKTLTSLEELYITGCKSLKDIVTHERANKNQEESIVEDEHDCQSNISIFQSLKKLHIRNCDLLKGIFPVSFAGELNDIDTDDEYVKENMKAIFPNLKDLSVYNCFQLKHIFPANIVGGLTQLKVLEIEECDMLDQIIGDIVPSTDRDKLIEEGTLSSLANLKIKRCGKLGSIFTTSIAKTLTSLEILRIEECKGLEYIIDIDDEYGKENMKAIFPNLKKLSVYDCFRLKYMFGQYDVANKDYKEIHIQFSALEILSLRYLPNFVSICSTNNLIVTWPSLKDFECYRCLYPFYGSREAIITSTKDPKGIQNHLPTLQTLNIKYSNAEHIFYLNEHEMIGQQVSLRLEKLELNRLPQMTYIWVGPNNSLTLQHLTTLKIWNCGKLEVIFPKSVVRFLPELKLLTIKECKELRQIIEGDRNLSNILSPQPCFPKLVEEGKCRNRDRNGTVTRKTNGFEKKIRGVATIIYYGKTMENQKNKVWSTKSRFLGSGIGYA